MMKFSFKGTQDVQDHKEACAKKAIIWMEAALLREINGRGIEEISNALDTAARYEKLALDGRD